MQNLFGIALTFKLGLFLFKLWTMMRMCLAKLLFCGY
uniref:Uncharacterized protein n=1 Tax=Rhizophora mucronata TaxID=61149 RepID=A0A2P2NLQ2_RHIMU